MTRPNPLRRLLLAAAALASPLADRAFAQDRAPAASARKIERLDPALDALIAPDAKIEVLAEGFNWAEGPVWDSVGGRLLFSDVPENKVYGWSRSFGTSVFLSPSGYTGAKARGGEPGSNGLTYDGMGRLVLFQHGDRRVARLEADGRTFRTLADRYDGKRLNSPNDGVYRHTGDLYFTDPPYGLLGKNHDEGKELDFSGVYRLSPDGVLTVLHKDLKFPNGIGLSPDQKTLYVGNSDPAKPIWTAFPVQADGSVGPGRVFADASPLANIHPGLPDGLTVDERGNVFATGPGGVLIYSPEGKRLGTIMTGVPTGNCAFGEDGSALYIAADMYIARVPLKTKGPVPSSRR